MEYILLQQRQSLKGGGSSRTELNKLMEYIQSLQQCKFLRGRGSSRIELNKLIKYIQLLQLRKYHMGRGEVKDRTQQVNGVYFASAEPISYGEVGSSRTELNKLMEYI